MFDVCYLLEIRQMLKNMYLIVHFSLFVLFHTKKCGELIQALLLHAQ